MKITEALKKWIVDNCEAVKADATDDEFRKAAGDAMAHGKLSIEKYGELTADPKEKAANEFGKKQDEILAGLDKLAGQLKPKEGDEADKEAKEKEAKEKAEKEAKEKADKEAKEKGTKTQPSMLAKMVARIGGTPDDPNDERDIDVRVKAAAEGYSDTKSAMTYPGHTKSGKPHPKAGKPVMDFSEDGRQMDVPSNRDRAVIGAWSKYLCSVAQSCGSRTIGFQRLQQHDKELIFHAMENMDWSGSTHPEESHYADIVNRRLTNMEKQALIDDALSGGFEAAPIVFDADVISTPLLHGELFPLVNVVPIDRGRRIEGVATGTVTGAWGGVDDGAIALFNTANYVTAFDTTIFRWEGAIRVGLDFLSDTPIDFGQHITQQYGERLLEDLDDVIATGNGATQPLGIIGVAGTTVGFGGVAATIGGYETLRFGVTKQEHRANVIASAVFCGTETSYIRMKGIPVGATDARRLFGEGGMGTQGYSNYAMMGSPYKIDACQGKTRIFYAILARYGMYRRRGLTMRPSTEGDTLIRANSLLMVATARYGGQLERAATMARTLTAQP